MISNNKISHVVSSEVPFFVRNEHENFVKFLEAYYRFLEQSDRELNRIKNIRSYQDIDMTEDEYAERLYATFMRIIPETVQVDKRLILKHIKDFYRAKGTEKAVRFLFQILFQEKADLYYPKKDVLRASDGKWYIQKSLRVTDTKVDNSFDSSLTTLEKFVSTKIQGLRSNTYAIVEKVERFFEQGTQVDELILSNIDGEFENGETIQSFFDEDTGTRTLKANIFSGIINSINVEVPGTKYKVGDPVVILSSTGQGACVAVAAVTTGNLSAVSVAYGGAGFRVNDQILFTGGGTGSGANGYVSSVRADGFYHPNVYNISINTIASSANVTLNSASFFGLISANANTTIANAISYYQYANTGPALTVFLTNSGQNYTLAPEVGVVGNSAIRSLGILGRMEIINGGQNYRIGDKITFQNVPKGYGLGALGEVANVNMAASNTISQVRFIQMDGHTIGGTGYSQEHLPKANVSSNTGTGANLVVTSIVSDGAEFITLTSTIGAIQRLTIFNRGSDYDQNTTIDLTASGDGNAKANASILQGLIVYPGRYLNDDGHLSSFNFLQDRDYYQNFSYVIRSKVPIGSYREILKTVSHPSGTKMFGEYLYENIAESRVDEPTSNSVNTLIKIRPYVKTGNTINIAYSSHGLSNGNTITLEFVSGPMANVSNGIYSVAVAQPNYIRVIGKNANNATGNVEVGILR